MIPSERSVAGLWCSEVLARLSEYVDGELTSEEVETVHAHLRGCNWCENFGGDFSGFVAEHHFSFLIPENNPAVAVDGDNGVNGRFHN